MIDRGVWRIVAGRDLWVRLRERGFVISTAINIVVISVLVLLRAYGGGGDQRSFDLGVVGDRTIADATADLGQRARIAVHVVPLEPGAVDASLRDGRVDAVLEGDNLTGFEGVDGTLESLTQAAARNHNLDQLLNDYDVPPSAREAASDETPLSTSTLEATDPHRDMNAGIAFVGVLLLYGQLFGYGIWVATGVIEEKSSRVVELLLSSIRARQLMVGKIVGIGLLGLGQLAFIATFAIGLALATGALGEPGSAIGAALLDVGWFVLGFAFYASVFAVAGSLVSRMEELQNAIVPVNLTIFVSFIISIGALQDPNSRIAVIASILPISSAMAMPVRIVLGAAEAWQIALALVLVIGSTAALVPLAGRLYAGAVLRSGARVKLRDAWRAAA
jgi:ABC-2 type transport system permease protein